MPQGSAEWFSARMGVVTASQIDALVTPKWKVKTGAGPKTYLCEKIAERVMGYSQDQMNGGTFAMDQGKIVETIAAPWYEFTYDVKVDHVGFILSDDGFTGCSPDGIVDGKLGLEIKSPQPPAMVRYFIDGVVPDDYLPQIQFSMFVTGFAEWEFVAFSRHIPPLVVRVKRDPVAQAAITEALELFRADFDAANTKLTAQLSSGGRA